MYKKNIIKIIVSRIQIVIVTFVIIIDNVTVTMYINGILMPNTLIINRFTVKRVYNDVIIEFSPLNFYSSIPLVLYISNNHCINLPIYINIIRFVLISLYPIYLVSELMYVCCNNNNSYKICVYTCVI